MELKFNTQFSKSERLNIKLSLQKVFRFFLSNYILIKTQTFFSNVKSESCGVRNS